jgi:antitoxin component YwqK of YwqJK toxin-antitoxin module
MDYVPWVEPVPEPAAEDPATEEGEEDQTERELMSELKRFYVEKFEGNVLREFYPSGALQSEAEVKEGRRHGRYREYYEDGTLLLRGRYAAGQPRGTWKYYTAEGEFDRKEKY